jgi:hypothetical protein
VRVGVPPGVPTRTWVAAPEDQCHVGVVVSLPAIESSPRPGTATRLWSCGFVSGLTSFGYSSAGGGGDSNPRPCTPDAGGASDPRSAVTSDAGVLAPVVGQGGGAGQEGGGGGPRVPGAGSEVRLECGEVEGLQDLRGAVQFAAEALRGDGVAVESPAVELGQDGLGQVLGGGRAAGGRVAAGDTEQDVVEAVRFPRRRGVCGRSADHRRPPWRE